MKILVHEWVTGGGFAGSPLPSSLASEGGAMRRAVATDFSQVDDVEVVMTLDSRFTPEPIAARVVFVEAGTEETTLLALAEECDHTIVIAPETEGVLADRTRLLQNAGRSILGSPFDAIVTTGDKLLFADHLTSLGIATPITAKFIPPDATGFPHLYPAVVKPRYGAGSEATYFLNRRQELANLPDDGSERIIQAYRSGEPMSASFLVGENGEAHLLAVGWQRIGHVEGRMIYQGGRIPGPRDRALGEPLNAIWSVPGLRGFVGVDFVWDEMTQSAEVIEINPRVTTSYVGLAHYFGPGMIAKAWLGVVLGTMGRESLAEMLRPKYVGVSFLPDGTIHE